MGDLKQKKIGDRSIISNAHIEQAFFKGMGQGGFPTAGKTGKPDQGASVAVEAVAVGLRVLPWKGKMLGSIYFTMKDMKGMKG